MNHLNVSLVKSIVRIAAGVALIDASIVTAGVSLIVAEILGVAEELV